MNPMLLQKQLKDNASDLQDFYKELKNWGEEMKKKDASLRGVELNDEKPIEPKPKKNKILNSNKKKKSEANSESKTKIGIIDYSAWDKFDADAECEKIDYNENEESDLTDECDEQIRDQAFLEKEKGNKFVKDKKWMEAIECYTKAIDYFSMDPIFYANRALCYLKINKPEKAEIDCTMSLKLDKQYVKAYQRRAAARDVLNKLEEAEHDLEKVLEFEPNNKESKQALKLLREKLGNIRKNKVEEPPRPISKFRASRTSNPTIATVQTDSNLIKEQNKKVFDTSKPVNNWATSEDIILVKSIKKPPHLRSKRPLKRIEITEVTELMEEKIEPSKIEIISERLNEPFKSKVIEKVEPSNVNNDAIINNNNNKETVENNYNKKPVEETVHNLVPKNSVQFYTHWKQLKSLELRYNYLKLLQPNEIPNVFKESLDSDIFSEILVVLAELFIQNGDRVFDYLAGMTRVKRFSTFTMFMEDNDKKCLWKLIDYIKEKENIKKENIDDLINKYEL